MLLCKKPEPFASCDVDQKKEHGVLATIKIILEMFGFERISQTLVSVRGIFITFYLNGKMQPCWLILFDELNQIIYEKVGVLLPREPSIR